MLLILQAPTPQNGQTHLNNSLAIEQRTGYHAKIMDLGRV